MSDLEPDRATRATWSKDVLGFLDDFIDELPQRPASERAEPVTIDALGAGPDTAARPLPGLLETIRTAAGAAVETAGPGYLAYFPAGGLYSSVLGETVAQTVNRFTGVAAMAPGMVALEQSVVRWFCGRFGLPAGAGGVVTSGASVATLSALHTAREARAAGVTGTIYVTEFTHHCVAKAARIAGFAADRLRVVPVDPDLRMDVDAAARMIRADRAEGLEPFLIVGTAGSTSTGTVDPLEPIAALARREDLWLHVDAAYGGGFQLTERGRELLRGIERADSLTFDPHKSLFLPYGTGVLLVRDEGLLRAAHRADGDYLQDLADQDGLPDYGDLGPELTRDSRGLRLWLPLHLHGVDAFRAALDEKLDLARRAYELLASDRHVEVPRVPDLTVLTFRSVAGDEASRAMLARINAGRRVFLSSTRVDGRFTLRMCVLSHRTHRDRVEEAVATVREAAAETA